MLIYVIENIKNNKKYIGKTTGTEVNRWYKHCRNAFKEKRQSKLYSALRKHGKESFRIYSIFYLIQDDKNLLDEYERYFISNFDTQNVGYNMTSGGDGGYTQGTLKLLKFNAERKGKTLEEYYGKEKANEIKLKKSKSMLGKHIGRKISDEQKTHLSKLMIKKYKNIDYRNKIAKINLDKAKHGENHPMYGKNHTKQARQKISQSRMGKTYQEIYGIEKANEIIQNKKLLIGSNNPNFKYVDINEILLFLSENPTVNLQIVSEKFNISRPTLSKRLKTIFSVDNIQKMRQCMSLEQFQTICKEKINVLY